MCLSLSTTYYRSWRLNLVSQEMPQSSAGRVGLYEFPHICHLPTVCCPGISVLCLGTALKCTVLQFTLWMLYRLTRGRPLWSLIMIWVFLCEHTACVGNLLFFSFSCLIYKTQVNGPSIKEKKKNNDAKASPSMVQLQSGQSHKHLWENVRTSHLINGRWIS